MKRIVGLLCMAAFIFNGCKKADELKKQIIDGYWQNFEEVVIEVKGDEAYIVDPGKSDFGSNPLVLDLKETPFLKNITEEGTNKWTADVIFATFEDDELVDYVYRTTDIKMDYNDLEGKAALSLSNSNAGFSWWDQIEKPVNLPDDPNGTNTTKTTCDKTKQTLKDDANTLVLEENDGSKTNYSKFTVTSHWDNTYAKVKCDYHIRAVDMSGASGSGRDFFITFGERPQAGKKYKVSSGDSRSLNGGIDKDEVAISYNSWECEPEGTVTVSGGGSSPYVITGKDVKLTHDYQSIDYKASFSIKAPYIE